MSDLVEFLRARLDEDEQRARAAAEYQGYDRWVVSEVAYEGILVGSLVDGMLGMATPTTRHIARWDPARVLAEVDAKRRIVDRCEHYQTYEDYGWALADEVLSLLALPYDCHPDYREEWRP